MKKVLNPPAQELVFLSRLSCHSYPSIIRQEINGLTDIYIHIKDFEIRCIPFLFNLLIICIEIPILHLTFYFMLALLLPDETFIFTTNATKLSRFITKSISHKSDENSSV